jgi:DNA-binding response OmpR family regulator
MAKASGSQKSILIVEDEWLIGDMLALALDDAHYATVGPAASVAAACALIEENVIDFAVLDVNLGSEKSFGAADLLAERGIPYLFMTGYGRQDLPEPHRSATLLGKPVVPEILIATIRSFLGDPADCAEAAAV